MRLTELEALTKRCHRGMHDAPAREGVKIGNCIGSKCAAWRWCGMLSCQNEHLGYCGLAGEPMSHGPDEED